MNKHINKTNLYTKPWATKTITIKSIYALIVSYSFNESNIRTFHLLAKVQTLSSSLLTFIAKGRGNAIFCFLIIYKEEFDQKDKYLHQNI